MSWRIRFSPRAIRDLEKLDRPVAMRIRDTLAKRVAAQPDHLPFGTMLVGDMEGLRRLRIGDYRVICELIEEELVVLALTIGHRKEIYH